MSILFRIKTLRSVKMQKIQDRLKQIRQVFSSENVSLFARDLGMKQPTYARYENGINKPSIELICLLLEKFNVNLNYLISGNGPMFIEQKSETQLKTEKALSERKTIGQRLNWLQGENHIEDNMLSKKTKISESRIRDVGLDKIEPTVSEAVAISDYFGITLDLFIRGHVTEGVSDISSIITPEEKKMLDFLKKAKENNLI